MRWILDITGSIDIRMVNIRTDPEDSRFNPAPEEHLASKFKNTAARDCSYSF